MITVLGFGLRLFRLDFQPLWFDEGYTVFFATRDIGTLLARTAVDIHPPLYYVLLQGWLSILGISPTTLRLFSVVAGTLAIPLLYWTARRLLPPTPSALAALLLAASPFHVFYSQEIRMYSLLAVLVLASFGLELEILQRRLTSPPQVVPFPLWAGYVLAVLAAIYTEYLGAFAVVGEAAVALWALWRAGRRGEFGSWVAAWCAAVLLYLPWVVYTAGKLSTYVAQKVGIERYNSLDPITYLAQHAIAFSVGHLGSYPWLAWGSIFFVGLAAAHVFPQALRRFRMIEADRVPLLRAGPSILIATIILCAYILNLVYPFHPVHYERLVLFAAPIFLTFVAAAIWAIAQQNRAFGISFGGIVLAISAGALVDFYMTPRYADEDYRPVIGMMREHATADDVLLAVYPWQIGYVEAYWSTPHPPLVEAPAVAWVGDSQRLDRDLGQLHDDHRGIWFLAYQRQGRILEDRITNALLARGFLVADEWSGNTRVEYIARGAPVELSPGDFRFEGGVTLAEFGAAPRSGFPGLDFVRIQLRWEAPPNQFAYSLRLVNRDGQTALQRDGPIFRDPPIQRLGFFLPSGAEPGESHLHLIVYRTKDGQPLQSASGDSMVDLGPIRMLEKR